MICWLATDQVESFPPLSAALTELNGLLVVGCDLSTQWLVIAYGSGIFPWFNDEDPILWWSPDPRMVLFPNELSISRSLHKLLKKHQYEIRTDTSFREVMQACAEPRKAQSGTWITNEMVEAYTTLHHMGVAHSVETWMDDLLVGGLYGIALGRMFYGESMFSRVSDASKIAFVHLVKQLEIWGFGMIDCQMKTRHLASLGAQEIPREEFALRLGRLIDAPSQSGIWHFDYTYPS